MPSIYFLSGIDDLKTIGQRIFPDLPTVIIQLVCTAILVFILAKFLVKPAKQFIAKRKEFIEGNLKDATEKNKEATEKLSIALNAIKESKSTSKEIIDSAKVDALNEKDKIIASAENEIRLRKSKAMEDIEIERKKMESSVQDEIIDVAMLAASKVVDREINTEDNKKIIRDFVKDDK